MMFEPYLRFREDLFHMIKTHHDVMYSGTFIMMVFEEYQGFFKADFMIGTSRFHDLSMFQVACKTNNFCKRFCCNRKSLIMYTPPMFYSSPLKNDD